MAGPFLYPRSRSVKREPWQIIQSWWVWITEMEMEIIIMEDAKVKTEWATNKSEILTIWTNFRGNWAIWQNLTNLRFLDSKMREILRKFTKMVLGWKQLELISVRGWNQLKTKLLATIMLIIQIRLDPVFCRKKDHEKVSKCPKMNS